MNTNSKKLILLSIFIAVIIIAGASYWRIKYGPLSVNTTQRSVDSGVSKEDEKHIHQRLLVFIGGNQFDLNQLHYMERDERAHFHENDGSIIHVHAQNITLPEFFKTIGMKLTSTCFIDDSNKSYCSNASSTLSILINRKIMNSEIHKYVLSNYDKILINYGSDTPLDLQLKMNSLDNLGSDY